MRHRAATSAEEFPSSGCLSLSPSGIVSTSLVALPYGATSPLCTGPHLMLGGSAAATPAGVGKTSWHPGRGLASTVKKSRSQRWR